MLTEFVIKPSVENEIAGYVCLQLGICFVTHLLS